MPRAPRLRVLAGPSPTTMTVISANSNEAHDISSDVFEGKVIVHIKGFPDASGEVLESEYFSRKDKKGITWSIQVQGRFLRPFSVDNILFGNTFDRPLKLPWGAGAALKFMNLVDPTLTHDLQSKTKPWALSPLVSTMPHLSYNHASTRSPPFPSDESIRDETSQLQVPVLPSRKVEHLTNAKQRRGHFSHVKNRKAVVFGPDDIITMDFCYGFITFPQLSLCLPGGISFDLTKYWDGQPVRFICLQRGEDGEIGPQGRSFWCVAIEPVYDDLDSAGSGRSSESIESL